MFKRFIFLLGKGFCVTSVICATHILASNDSNSKIDLIISAEMPVKIVKPAKTSPMMEFAAKELQKYIGQMTQTLPEIVDDSLQVTGQKILITSATSVNSQIKSIISTDKLSAADSDAFVLKAMDGTLVIAGGADRAVLYGVYDFLERMGCRWFGPGEDYIPKSENFEVSEMELLESPGMHWRGMEWISGSTDAVVDWATKMKLNVSWPEEYLPNGDMTQNDTLFKKESVPEMLERGLTIFWGGHILNVLFPFEKYKDEHPEYFAEVDGIRLNPKLQVGFGRSQLCTSNDEVMYILTNNTIEFLRNHPWIDVLFIWANDTTQWCECEKCLALEPVPKKPDPAGNYDSSATYSRMIKIIYEGSLPSMTKQFKGVKQVLPGRKMAFNHYYNLENIPRDKDENVYKACLPDRTVLSAVDDYVQCNRHRLDNPADCPRAARKGVEKIATMWGSYYNDSVFWNYYFAGNFTKGHPVSMAHKIPLDFQYARSLGINGTIDNVTLTPPGRPSSYNHWELNYINFYIYGKASWNPGLNVDAVLKDYLENYYGPAAEPMLKFWNLMEETTIKFGMDKDFMPEDPSLTTPSAIHEWMWNIRYVIPNQRVYSELTSYLKEAREMASSAYKQPMKLEQMPYVRRLQILQGWLSFWPNTKTEEKWTYHP